MLPAEFKFFGFEPKPEERDRANHALERIMDRAPYGARIAALVRFERGAFECAVELYSSRGPCMAKASSPYLHEAVRTVERRLERQIERRSPHGRRSMLHASA